MADNVAITAGSGTAIAADDVSSVYFQKVKLDVGGDGVSAPLSNSNPVPVSDAGGTLSIDDGSGSLTVDGTVTASRTVVSAHHFVAAASDNAASVKASAGTLKGFSIFNAAAVPIYLKFHNTAGTPTAGSGVVRTFGIQAGVHVSFEIPDGGLSFGTGIGFTLVKAIADNGTTATAASDAVGEIFYT